jgi:hypothetical protein
MRLDRTRIAIRERSLLDILDLSLRVVAAYPGPILLGTVVAALPLALFNEYLIGWMTGEGDDPSAITRYIWTMTLLVFFEAPLASVAVTLYLGQALFMDNPQPRDILQGFRRSFLTLAWCQFMVRGIGAAWLLTYFARHAVGYSAQEGWLIPLAIYVLLLRAVRPFINEIVLLEQNPLRGKSDYVMTVRRRSTVLHNPTAGDLFARWLMSALVAIAMVVSLVFGIWYAMGMLLFKWDWGWMMPHVGIPVCMWVVGGYFSVVRFLSYLDLRIRREGWEVELVVRAAAAQMPGTVV